LFAVKENLGVRALKWQVDVVSCGRGLSRFLKTSIEKEAVYLSAPLEVKK